MRKFAFLILILLIATGLTLAQPTETPMPKNGKIAFVARSDYSSSSGDAHIYTINPDGTDLQMFGDGECETYAPQWSPDSKSFAYYLQCKGEESIHKIATEDRHAEIKGILDFYFHNWSPDGKKILLAKDTKLFVADSDGTNLKEVFEGGGSLTITMSWLPDSRHILFRSDRNYSATPANQVQPYDLYTVNIENQELLQLPSDMYGLFADFTSDGKLAVVSGERFGGGGDEYVSPYYTHVYSVKMGGDAILQFDELLFEIDGWQTRWSPDEERMVMVFENNIAVVDKDGENLQVLTEGLFTKDVQLYSPVWQRVLDD